MTEVANTAAKAGTFAQTGEIGAVVVEQQPKKRGPKGPRRQGPGLSFAEGAEELDVPVRQLKQAVEDGLIKVVKLGTMVRIPHSEIVRIKELFGDPG